MESIAGSLLTDYAETIARSGGNHLYEETFAVEPRH